MGIVQLRIYDSIMKIAIPVFHSKISPRFDEAQEFVLLETEGASIISKENFSTKGWSTIERMKQLVSLGVETLICGGIDRGSLQYLSFNGIKIYSWVTAEVDDAIDCYMKNKMRPGLILGENGRLKGRWQFCNGKNHLCNMFLTGFYKDEKEVDPMPRGDGTGPRGKGPRTGRGRGGCQPGKGGRGGRGVGRSDGYGNRQGRGQGRSPK